MGIDLFGLLSACTFCFPNTDHVVILRRFGLLFCSLKRVHAGIFMLACPHFNEQNKRPNLLSIITWSVLGKQNVQAEKVYRASMKDYFSYLHNLLISIFIVMGIMDFKMLAYNL